MLFIFRQHWRISLAIALSLVVSGCQNKGLKEAPLIVSAPSVNTGAPSIKKLVDIGALDLPVGSELPDNLSDGRFTPGEWLLIQGRNLSAPTVSINDKEYSVTRYFNGNPLVKVPTGLSPKNIHTVRINTDFGSASSSFFSSHYLIASDTDGKNYQVVRTHPNSQGNIEEEWLSIKHNDLERPLFGLMSIDSRFFYAVNVKDRAEEVYRGINAYELEIFTYHLGYPNKPKLIKRDKVVIGSSPIDAIISDDGTLLFLGKQSFTTLDASDPLDIKEIGSRKLPKLGERTTYVDAVFMDSSKKIAVLETHSNTVVLIENTVQKQFPSLSRLSLLPEKTIPLSVDLELDPENDNELWVLQGQNYRLADETLKKLYRKIRGREIADSERSVSQLQKLVIEDGKLSFDTNIPLPLSHVAYFSKFGNDGRIYITMTKLDFINSQIDLKPGRDFIKNAGKFLWDAVSVGQVIAVDKNSGEIEQAAAGVGIYYDVVDIPDVGQAFTLMKLGPSFSFPGLTPNWGVGITSTGTYTKRKMGKHTIFPPYSVGFIVYQE